MRGVERAYLRHSKKNMRGLFFGLVGFSVRGKLRAGAGIDVRI